MSISHPRAAHLVETLGLSPHPEGGSYREVYRSDLRVGRSGASEERSALTLIYFLLVNGQHSCWHSVSSDEIWSFCEGGPMDLFCLCPSFQELITHRLGPFLDDGQPTAIIPANYWQAEKCSCEYTLVSCAVAPGFDFQDFAFMSERDNSRSKLLSKFPEMQSLL